MSSPWNLSNGGRWLGLLLLLPICGYGVEGISSSSAVSVPPPKLQKRRTAIVVGGGPAGIAAANLLSQCHDDYGFDGITILEQDEGVASYNPSRAYCYNINKRGQRFTDAFNIDLSERGVGVTAFAKHTVPADPAVVFDGTTPFSRNMSPEEQRQMGTLYWIPRHDLVQLMLDSTTAASNGNKKIEVCRGFRCQYVEPTADGRVRVVGHFSNTTKTTFVTDLCVGADGMSSTVRESLADGRFEGWTNAQPARSFLPRQYTSPATGLRIKGLLLQPNFTIPMGGTEHPQQPVILEQGLNYALMSATEGPTNALTLTLLPQKNITASRSINICTMPNHDLWKIQDGAKLKSYFVSAFPRFDWNTIVAPEEWDAFVSATGASFPPCQYSPRLCVSSPTTESGVVLLGDALHTFPPDLGQGVNSAFCDVMMLGDCLEQAQSSNNNKPMLARALHNYQKQHGPETRALIQLARCDAPFQYNQPSRYLKFRKSLWTANVALRLLLHKVTLGLSPKPAVLIMMGSSVSFRRIMRQANTLTIVLWTVLLSALWRFASLPFLT